MSDSPPHLPARVHGAGLHSPPNQLVHRGVVHAPQLWVKQPLRALEAPHVSPHTPAMIDRGLTVF